MSGFRLLPTQCALLVVDVQEKLAAAMPKEALERMLKRTGALVEGARALGLPIVFTEQYPKGLGPTVAALREKLSGLSAVEKLRFSGVDDRVRAQLGRRQQVLVAGMETHICVYQTVRELAEDGLLPVLCADAVLSRFEVDMRVGLQLAADAGAMVSTVETALFDLLGEAGTPEFKRIRAAIR
jgi:nicotinamidase-related amidase